MKMRKNQNFVRVLALVLCLAMALCACGGEAETNSGEKTYQVTVADAAGTPYTTGVIVCFMQNGEQIAMQTVDENGMAAKALPAGEYTVELVFTGDESEYYYDQNGLTLTAEQTELTVVLAYNQKAEPETIYAQGVECQAYPVTVGSTYVSLTDGERNYFLFAPEVAGTYAFSSSDAAAVIGYYGAPHFVQELSAAEVTDNSFSVSVSAGSIGSTFVIGIDAQGVTGCILSIQRTGEPEHTLADEPWMVYSSTVKLAAYTLPAGAVVKEFDLTASSDTYVLVYNDNDGFYHLDSEDGPLVLVRLAKDNDYLGCYKTILDSTGVVKYFFDENGEFIKKESYTDCLLEYLEYVDEDNGVYPLTEDLRYIIQSSGEYSGWFDSEGGQYIFLDKNLEPIPGINEEISWLFMCCYIGE